MTQFPENTFFFRMNKKGRALIFGEDIESSWIGVPWEVSGTSDYSCVFILPFSNIEG